jgi:hypothetical protein
MNTEAIPPSPDIPQEFLNYMHDKAQEAGDNLVIFQEQRTVYTAGYKAGGITAYKYIFSLLTEKQRKMIAFSLFSMGMRMGPSSFEDFESIVQKIGIENEFVEYAKDWIGYAERKKSPTVGDVIGDSEL